MSLNFGGSSGSQRGGGTTVIQPAAPSPEEQELRSLNLQLAKKQLTQFDAAQAEQTAFAGSPLGMAQAQLQQKATQNLLARLTGQAPVLTPEEQQQLDTVYGASQAQGEQDLTRYAQQLAGMRGLSTADSPIFNEVLNQRRLFGEQLGGQKAASALNLGQAGADFNARIAEFQNNLQQQAFQNRLNLVGMTPASYGLQQSLFGERLVAAPRTSTQQGRFNATNWNAGISGQQTQALAGSEGLFAKGGIFG